MFRLKQLPPPATPSFRAHSPFSLVYMGVLCFVYMVVSVQTNICFFLMFLLLIPTFACLTALYFGIGANSTLLVSAGAMAFVISLLGWDLFFMQLLAAVEFPLILPVGVLSRFIRVDSGRKNK